MSRPAQALVLLLAFAVAAGAVAQQPPPGGARPPPPGMGPPPNGQPPGANAGNNNFRPPPPPPPPQVIYLPAPQQPADSAPATAVAPTAAPVVETPKPPALPTAVQPFPQLQDAKPPPPLEFGGERDAAKAAATAGATPATPRVASMLAPPPLPRWLWLLAGACVLLLLGWYAALRKSRALGDEAERLARHQRQLQSQHVQLKSQSEHLRQLATNDPLTGILNRQGFSSELRTVLEHLQRFRRPLNLLLFDMDNFKQVNDSQGHLVGDQAIRMVVGVVQEHLDSDDLFGRFGGDEFMIAIADQPIDKVQVLAEAIRLGVVRAAGLHEPALGGLSLSIGIAQANEAQGYAADALFQRADTALYAAKNTGRNRVVLADEALAAPPVLAAATRHLA